MVIAATHAHAVTDAPNDFLPSFAGTHSGALDILSADVTFDPAAKAFLLHAQTAGPITDLRNAALVFGFNRGGTAGSPFASIGEPDVTFNATAVLSADGTGKVGSAAIPVSIAGNDIRAVVLASLLPSNGLDAKDFSWALWSVDSSIVGLTRNADFASDANIRVAAVPEPETYAMMLAGLGVLGFVAHRRAAVARG
jgi:hypothetical protein